MNLKNSNKFISKIILLLLIIANIEVYSQKELVEFPMPICEISDKTDSIKFLIINDIYLVVFLEEKKIKSSSFYFQETNSYIKTKQIDWIVSKLGLEAKLKVDGTPYAVTISLNKDSTLSQLSGRKINNNGYYILEGWNYTFKQHSIYSKQSIYKIERHLNGEKIGNSVSFYDNQCENLVVVSWQNNEPTLVLGKPRKQGFFWDLFHKDF